MDVNELLQKLPVRGAHARAAQGLAWAAPHVFAGKVRRPFFLVGAARSGTTMLKRLLLRHPDLAVYPNEANEYWHPQLYPFRHNEAAEEVPPFWIEHRAFTEATLEKRTARDGLRLKALFGAFQWLSGKQQLLNKSALLTFLLPYVESLFPGARYIHLYRDGRAVALSHEKKNAEKLERDSRLSDEQRGAAVEDRIGQFVRHWQVQLAEIDRRADELSLRGEDRFLEIQYEALCEHPERELRRLLAFMGLAENAFAFPAPHELQNRNYKYRRELSEETVARLTDQAAEMLARRGYATHGATPSPS